MIEQPQNDLLQSQIIQQAYWKRCMLQMQLLTASHPNQLIQSKKKLNELNSNPDISKLDTDRHTFKSSTMPRPNSALTTILPHPQRPPLEFIPSFPNFNLANKKKHTSNCDFKKLNNLVKLYKAETLQKITAEPSKNRQSSFLRKKSQPLFSSTQQQKWMKKVRLIFNSDQEKRKIIKKKTQDTKRNQQAYQLKNTGILKPHTALPARFRSHKIKSQDKKIQGQQCVWLIPKSNLTGPFSYNLKGKVIKATTEYGVMFRPKAQDKKLEEKFSVKHRNYSLATMKRRYARGRK